MGKQSVLSTIVIVFTLICSPVAAEEAKQTDHQEPKGAHVFCRFESPEGTVFEGIDLTSVNQLGYASRKMLVGMDGRGVVLTKVTDASGGKVWSQILDDQTGWWLAITYDYGLSWPTLQDGISYMGENSRPNREHYPTVDIKVETFEGLLFDARASLKGDLPVETMLVEAKSWLAEGNLLASVPQAAQTASALLFNLRRLAFDPPGNFGGDSMDVVWLLDALTEGSAREGMETAWEVTPSEFLKPGLLMKDPELLAVTRQFKSIDPVDPMKGFHTAERFPTPEL